MGPGLGTVGAVAADRELDRRRFGFGHRRIDELRPIAAPKDLLGGNLGRILKRGPGGPEARPGPVLRPSRKARAERVPLDVTDHSDQEVVVLDQEPLESALPDMTAVVVVFPIALDMRGHEPLHPAGEVAVSKRSDDKVEMVGHQTVCQQTHRQPYRRLADRLEESLVIPRLMKNLGSGVPPIQDVIAIPCLSRAVRGINHPLYPI